MDLAQLFESLHKLVDLLEQFTNLPLVKSWLEGWFADLEANPGRARVMVVPAQVREELEAANLLDAFQDLIPVLVSLWSNPELRELLLTVLRKLFGGDDD